MNKLKPPSTLGTCPFFGTEPGLWHGGTVSALRGPRWLIHNVHERSPGRILLPPWQSQCKCLSQPEEEEREERD